MLYSKLLAFLLLVGYHKFKETVLRELSYHDIFPRQVSKHSDDEGVRLVIPKVKWTKLCVHLLPSHEEKVW